MGKAGIVSTRPVQRLHFAGATLVANLFRQLFLVCLRRRHTCNEESHLIRQPVLPFFLKKLSRRIPPRDDLRPSLLKFLLTIPGVGEPTTTCSRARGFLSVHGLNLCVASRGRSHLTSVPASVRGLPAREKIILWTSLDGRRRPRIERASWIRWASRSRSQSNTIVFWKVLPMMTCLAVFGPSDS